MRKADTGGVGRRLRGEIVHGGSQTAGDDRHTGAAADLLQDGGQLIQLIADRRSAAPPSHRNVPAVRRCRPSWNPPERRYESLLR
ncbi:MAG: hypothetical protein MZU91_14715 [Desulfosudis oleivorans]|nr:hypothetical protein [Desulfosudis oleivorans]